MHFLSTTAVLFTAQVTSLGVEQKKVYFEVDFSIV